jgi:hypothetical protein
MMERGRVLLLVAPLAALALLAGCGGSSGDQTTVTVQTGSLSKAEFISRADAICTAARAEFVKKLQGFYKAHPPTSEVISEDEREAGLLELVESILAPNLEGELAQIGKLGAPKGYAPEVTAFVDAVEKGLNKGREDPIKFAETDESFAPARAVARRAGMNGCAESFG